MTTIHITVPLTYAPPNNYTLLHHAVVWVSRVGCHSATQNGFTAGDVLAKLGAAGFPDEDIERGGNELLAHGRTTFESDTIGEDDLRRVELI
ncbi:MAG TPA: hypothetical protein VN948_21615 [Terriglobales bacterium]|nr:hypothetical protein [Terriglobales bacterium]